MANWVQCRIHDSVQPEIKSIRGNLVMFLIGELQQFDAGTGKILEIFRVRKMAVSRVLE
jgi:hypothetical protein